MTRQSPSSSRNRSTSRVVSLGTAVVASALLIEKPPQIAGGEPVETDCRAAFFEVSQIHSGQLPGEPADRFAQLGRTAGVVAAPERQPGRLSGAGTTSTRSWVIR